MTGFEIEREKTAFPGPALAEHVRDGGRKNLVENDRKIEQTIAFMRRHLDRPVQVAELATLANVSPSHYFALFKRRVGCAPIDYFIRLRMHQACRLLETTSLTVKEVAAALGYDDPFYFSRIFKSVNGLPPSYYRLRLNGSGLAENGETLLPPDVFPWTPPSTPKAAGRSAPDGDADHEWHGDAFSVSREVSVKQFEEANRSHPFD